MVAELYRSLGHQAKRTGSTGDHGVDVVVQARNGEKWIVQCKRWRGSVGEPVIRDFYGVLHHEKADHGAVITTGTFTPQAREWARGKLLHLYDGGEFLTIWERV
jgi:restriction system protein